MIFSLKTMLLPVVDIGPDGFGLKAEFESGGSTVTAPVKPAERLMRIWTLALAPRSAASISWLGVREKLGGVPI